MKTERDTNVMFFHGKTIDGNRFTMAGAIIGNRQLSIGVAVCSENDKFTKETGRNISYGRCVSERPFVSGKKLVTIPSHIEKESEYFYEIASSFNEDKKSTLIYTFDLNKKMDLPF